VGYGLSSKQEPAGNRKELLLQPTRGLESGGVSHPEDVNLLGGSEFSFLVVPSALVCASSRRLGSTPVRSAKEVLYQWHHFI
jgi:hypothetical protein